MDKRCALYSGLLALLAGLFVFFSLLLVSRIWYQKGLNSLRAGDYRRAVYCFDKALMPVALADHQRLHVRLGETLYKQGMRSGEKQATVRERLALFEQGRCFLESAVRALPTDYFAVYWLAKTEAVLKVLRPRVPGTAPIGDYQPGSQFERAIRLRPHGVTVRFDYAAYLHVMGRDEKIPTLVREIMICYPGAYEHLKNAPFFSRALVPDIKAGLAAAENNNVVRDQALKALIEIALDENEPDRAIGYFQQKLKWALPVTETDRLRLGGLYLQTGQTDAGLDLFRRIILSSADPAGIINRIYPVFAEKQKWSDFIDLADQVEAALFRFPALDRRVAAALIKTGRLEAARERLQRLVADQPDAEAYYLLATIARIREKWSEMELSSRQATVLAPDNRHYGLLFSESLQHQEKYGQAEAAVSRLIDAKPETDPLLLNRRAWIRFVREKYPEAIKDWLQASALLTGDSRAICFYRISQARHRQGRSREALGYIDQALALSPDNDIFKKWKQTLERFGGNNEIQ